MDKEFFNKLKDLRDDIKDYAKYLETETYHPYHTVAKFANELTNIIKEYNKEY